MALVNVSWSGCSLGGWPHIQMLDAHVRPIPIRTSRSHPGPGATITVGTWRRAYFTIHFTGAGPCLPRHRVAQGVRVTPPGDSGGQIVPERLDRSALPLPVPISIDPRTREPRTAAAAVLIGSAPAQARVSRSSLETGGSASQ